jgi:hypothetical protein
MYPPTDKLKSASFDLVSLWTSALVKDVLDDCIFLPGGCHN